MKRAVTSLAIMLALLGTAVAAANGAQQAIVKSYADQARSTDPAFKGFSAARGDAFFHARHAGGKPETPTCTSCHTDNPKARGKTRAGKVIEPMAASANPKRFTDAADVEKWFRRNCNDVLGRACTPAEKGDVLTYLLGE
jgi:hypothetical protein